MKPLLPILLVFAGAWQTSAQIPWDTSGNGLLKGTYNFRQIYFEVADNAGNFGKTVAIWGGITFDGNGNYTLTNASVLDSMVGSVKTLTLTGTYSISSSGFGFMDSPALKGGRLYGLVAQGIFVSSTTEDQVNDLFIAAPVATTAPTLASFNGRYWVAEMNFPSITSANARDAFFQINPNGQGALGTVSLTAFTGDSGNPVKQSIAAATYAFSANQGTISYGTSSTQVNGDRILYLTPDGNFIFGGSTTGADMFVGVRAFSGSATSSALSGLYYQAGIDQDNSTLTSDSYTTIDSYYGSFIAVPQTGDQLGHQRLITGFNASAFDYTYSDTYTIAADGSHDDFFGFHNIVGLGGNIQIGYGTGAYLGITIAVKAPNFTGTGVFVSPVGVVNAASYSPFTVGLSRGAMVRIFGTNLAAATQSDGTFPKTLAGVQVMMNNRQAPIYQVSPTQIVAVVPWATTEDVVSVKVINNGTTSNAVTEFNTKATPGIFTSSQNGIGYAAALHPDFTVVTPQSPARSGETIAVYMTGLGQVTPAVADGVAGPANPLSKTANATTAFVDGKKATVVFSGLAPQLIGLYQMNITIPTGTTPGDVFLDIGALGAYSSQVQLPIGRVTGSGSDVSPLTSTGETNQRARGRSKSRIPANASPKGIGARILEE